MINLHIKYFNINEQFEDNANLLLVVENKKVLYSLLNDLFSGENYFSYFELFNEDARKIKSSDLIDFIPSLLTLEINQKKNINMLLRDIKNNYYDQINEKVVDIRKQMDSLIKFLKIESNYNLIANIDFEDEDLIKDLNIKFSDDNENILEKITNYIKAVNGLRGVKCFIFYGLLDFLDEYEMKLLLKECKYMNVKVIVIESTNNNTNYFDRIYVLDNDLCVME